MFKKIFLLCVTSGYLHALEYEKQFENELVNVAKIKIAPHEEIGLHRDEFPQVVIALKGGIGTRIEADGRFVDVEFPTGVPVFRDVDPPNEFHRTINRSDEPIEIIVIQLKPK